MEKPQMILHQYTQLNYTAYDCKWIPSSPKFIVLGGLARGTGCLDIFEVTAADVTHVKQIEKSKPFKCGTFGASSLQQRHFATGDFDGRMCIWNLEKPEIPIYHVKGHKEIINSIDGVGGLNIGEGAPEIVTGSRDGLVKLWDSRQPVEPVAVMAPSKPEGDSSSGRDCWTVAFGNAYTPEERCVAAGYDNGDVKLFDLRAMTVRWETNLKNGVCHLEFDRKDICMNKLVATTLEQKCHVFDLRTLNEKSSYATTSLKAHDSTIWACRHLPQNRDVFVTCGGEGSIHLWKYNYPANRVQEDSEKKPVGVIGNVELIQDVRLGGQPINAFDWSPDTQGLAVATGFDQSCFLLGSLCHAALPADDSLCMDITDRLLNGGGKLVDDLVDYKATRRRHPLLYLQRKVTPPRQVSGNPIAFCWHPGQPLFAICTYNEQLTSGAVSFFDGDGGFEQKFPARNRPSCPDCVTWHPNPSKRLLVVSWRDAKITVYDLDKNAAQEGSPTELPITRFIWHAEEPFPLTAIDRANHLILWKTGAVNISKPTSVHDASQAVVCLAFLGQRIEATQSRKLDGISPMTGGQTDFLIGCQGGGVFHLNMDGNLVEVRQLNEPVVSLTYWHTSGIPIRNAYVVTETLRVIRYQATNSNVFEEKLSVVLIGKTPASSLCWIDADTLAVASVENILRVWDIPRLQHSDLSVQEFTGTEDSEVIRTISVNKRTGVVMGATNTGNVLFWSLLPRTSSNTDKSQTIACPISSAKRHAEVMTIQSSVAGTDFLAASQKEVFLFQARSLVSATAYPVVAIQVSANVFSVMHEAPGAAAFYKTRFTIVGLAASEKTVAVWGEDQATIYDLTLTNQLKESATFHRDFIALGLYGANLVAAKSSSLSLLSRQGVAGKLDLRIPPNEGSTALFDIHGRFCVIATTSGHMKLADLDRIDRKQWTKSKSVKDTTSLFAKFIDVKLNFNGSFVAFLIDENVPTPKCAKIYTWDTERDTVLFYDCLLEKDALMSRDKTFSRAWLPVRLIWDCNDSRLLCVSFTAPDTSARQDSFSSNMATFFPSSEKGLLLNAVMNLADGGPGLFLCCAAPWVLLYAGSTEKGGKLAVIKRLLPDFSGFLSDNPDDLKTIINFCYFSALDKIAEAVNTVKTSNTALVWNHLAKLCVRRGKLEYSKMCLSRLGRADILANLRHFALNNPQPEVQLGHLAALLQLKEVAETHFSASKSPELSVELQQAAGDWTGVLEKPPSTTADRLSRRQTLYALAKDDMTFGDFQQAIEKFTEANCEKFDVPRLLLKKRPADLRAYIEKSTDRKLLEWYGRFLEMQGEIEEAVEYYSKAGDLKSVVRTMSDDVDEALALVRSSKDKAAAFQLAHTLEVDDDTEPQILIELFEIASAYSNAIRVCMDHGLDDKLVQLALKSEKPEMLGAAKYLEGKGLADKAITLFHRAGQLTKATDLAFEQGYYGNIETISEDIDENSDPVLLDRCVAYFSEHNQIDRAVNLLIRAKKLYAAVKLCIQHQMTIDKRLVSLVLEQKSTGAVNIAERTSVIQQLADRCSAQGLYHEAARLLIDIKQPEAAMYALVKTGDIDAILRYIRIIRDPDALIVAGNNLQAHPWHQKKEIFDAIVLAYKRAGAQLYLASFYDSWGETACESGRYDVATEAFGKSYDILAEVLSSKETAKDMETAKEEMDTKRKVVSYFLEVQRESQTSPEAAIPLSEELVKHCKWDSGVRAGHVFALLISVSITIGAIPKAKAYLRKLRTECPTSHTLTDYVDETVLQQLQ